MQRTDRQTRIQLGYGDSGESLRLRRSGKSGNVVLAGGRTGCLEGVSDDSQRSQLGNQHHGSGRNVVNVRHGTICAKFCVLHSTRYDDCDTTDRQTGCGLLEPYLRGMQCPKE